MGLLIYCIKCNWGLRKFNVLGKIHHLGKSLSRIEDGVMPYEAK